MKKYFLLTLSAFFFVLKTEAQTWPQRLKAHQWLITSVRTGDTDVFSINPATGNALNLTQSPASEERYPAWSPDGRKIIFTSNREDEKTYNIYIANADGSQPQKITQLPTGAVAYWAAFTDDGRYIYFNEGVSGQIMRVRPDGTGQQIIAEGRDANISPDGQRFVYTQKGTKGFGVWVMDSDGKNRRQIIPNESEIGGIAPVWSSDGKKIAFSMQVGEFAEIMTCNADGSDLKQITYLKQISSSPAFSPDGQYITFRVTNEAYWRDAQKMKQTYDEKAGDKRPVWVVKSDGTMPTVVEVLRYQCAMDGSRAEWKPR
ncbi:MAG: TolB family protein [Runella sp.]